jgi:colanic acid/amylovoran biosynthesis glycosyltransferase
VFRNPGVATGTWCRRQLAGHLLALRPQLVHFDSGREAANWLTVTDELNCAMVVGLTAEDLYGSGPEPVDRCDEVWTRAAAVHFSDRAVEQRALQRGCPADLPRAVIPPFVDPAFFAVAEAPDGDARPPGTLRILSADALEWPQGFEHAIHAIRLLRDAGVDSEYTIIGDGEYLPALTFARHQLGVGDRVHISESVSPNAFRDCLRSADVFLSASVVDGLPWTMLQALSSGTPVVMSDPGSLGDGAIEQGAFIVPRRDPKSLADRLATLAGDERLRQNMGRAAREWAAEHVTPAQRLSGLDRLFRRARAPSGSAQ